MLLRSDVVRKELVGLDPRTPARAEVDTGIYAPDSTARTYDELLSRARVALELGESVVIDASWTDRGRRADAAALATMTSSDFVELRCDVSATIADDRLRGRRLAGGDASDADEVVAAEMRRRAEPWPTATVIDTSGSRDAAADQAVTAATADRPGGA